MNGEDVGLAKLESPLGHHSRKDRREGVICIPALPDGHCEKLVPFSDPGVEDQTGRRVNRCTAIPTLPVLVRGHCWRSVNNRYGHITFYCSRRTGSEFVYQLLIGICVGANRDRVRLKATGATIPKQPFDVFAVSSIVIRST